jgi:hypothetical protein
LTPERATTTPPTASCFDKRRDAKGVANPDVGDVPDEHGHAVTRSNDDVLDVVDGLDQADAANNRPGAVRLDDVSADIGIALTDGAENVAERKAETSQTAGIDVDLVLLDRSADGRHFRDAGHGVELIPDEPVLEAPQVAK